MFWQSATGHKASDELFSYYSFFIADEPNTQRTISSDNLLLRSPESKGDSETLTNGDAPVSIQYGHLYKDGPTRYVERDPDSIAQLPSGYAHYNTVSYDVRTEALVSGPHRITFNLPSVSDQATFQTLRVLHSESDPLDPTRAKWVDRTILAPDSPSPDFTNRNISAKVNEVGPFLIARLVSSPPPNTNSSELSMTILESADPVVAGDDLVYTINVTNNGPDMATGVALSSGLSPDVRFVSADALTRTCNEINGTVVCDLDSIAPGTTLPVTITVKPDEGQTQFPVTGKVIFNSVFVTGNESDPNEANNEITISTNALPNPNAPPTTAILGPAKDAIFSGPANFSVVVGAADSDGSVTQVEIFLDGISVGDAVFLETGKYKLDLAAVDYGEHTFASIVTDNGGRKAVSDTRRIFVNGPIIVTLDSPDEAALFGTPANIALSATATNSSGTVSQVQVPANGEPIGVGVYSGAGIYNYTWINTPIGNHSLRAVATDANGVKSWSESANIHVSYAPIVAVTAPSSGSVYPQPASTTLSATASDFDGYVSTVEFLVNGTGSLGFASFVQGSTFELSWANVQAGTYSITAKATDDAGLISVSDPVSITVTNNPPAVAVLNPASGSTFSPLPTIDFSADASDSDGSIDRVDFFNGSLLLGTVYGPPYQFSWSNVIAGNHTLTARATDNNNSSTVSSPVSITVNSIGTALFVVGNTTLNGVDSAILTRLQNLGLSVVIKSASAAVTGDATGKTVVVVSDSVTPANVNTKFRGVAVPVVTLDPQLFDDMGMTPTASTNYGTTTGQKNVAITSAGHPMAGGLTGTVQVTSSNTTFGWGKPNVNAAKISTLTADSTKATSFGYVSGAVMPGLTAPARRVAFFYTASSSNLTSNGGVLFDNSIRWAAGL